MDLSAKHIGFVIASYAITGIVLVGLGIWLAIKARRVTRRLEKLEAEGATRRRKDNPVKS